MAPWKLFSVADTVKYKAFTCSWSIFILCLIYAGLIVVPILILYRIGNSWPTDSDYEQPSLQFARLFFVSMKTSRSGKDVIIYSSTNSTEQFRPSNFRIPSVTSQEFDDNGDGKKDRMDFEMRMPLLSNESIHELDLILIYNYMLGRSSRVFESFVRIHSSQNLPKFMTLEVIGFTRFVQLKYLQNPRGVLNYLEYKRKTGKSKCSDLLTSVNVDSFDVISCYVDSRQAFLELSDVKYSWQPTRSEGGAFVLRALIGYEAKQTIIYEAYHWLAAKWLYIQFMAVFLLLACLAQTFLTYLFLNRLVDSFIEDREVKEKQS